MKEVFKHYEVYKNGNQWRGTFESYAGALAKAEALAKNKNNYIEIWKISILNFKEIRRLVAFWN